ncbi:MAG: class I SAM-dependent methyltransferase, partial [Nitrososphaerota archaeon]
MRIVDLCSGTGIGGIALAKNLLNLGIRADLPLLDLRRKALSKGEEFCSRELGFKPETLERDMLEDIGLRTTFDIALMWGYTTPHFNPWNWVKALANVSQLLKDDGLFIYDELDRTYTVF